MRNVNPILFFVALAILTLGGCAIEQPTATVLDVKITDQSEQGARVELTVRLDNPSDIPLPLPKATYSIRVEGARTFSFTDIPTVMLPAHGSQTMVFPAAFATSQSLIGKSYSASGSISYHPPGELRQLLDQYKVPLPATTFMTSGKLQ